MRSWRTRKGAKCEQPKLRRLDLRGGRRFVELGSKHRRLAVADLVRAAFPDLGPTPASDDVLGAVDRARRELKTATLECIRRGDMRTADLLTFHRDHLARLAADLARNIHEAAP